MSNFTTSAPGDAWDCSKVHTSEELWQQFSEHGMHYYGVMSVPLIALVLIFSIYLDEVFFLLRGSVNKERTRSAIWILSAYPFWGICFTTGLFAPRTSEVVAFASNYYYAVGLKKFVQYVIQHYGSREALVEALKGDKVVPSNPVPCCFVCCCHNQPLSLKRFRKLEWVVYQVVWIYPVFGFLQLVMFAEFYGRMTIAVRLVMALLGGVCTCSSFVCLYGYIIIGGSSRFTLKQFRYQGKFITVQMLVGFNTLQKSTINLLS
uniref:Uncharacterized protein n=1 Tax=Ciona savignyi TaxID=51511 RepID=H2Z3G5_CIOSA